MSAETQYLTSVNGEAWCYLVHTTYMERLRVSVEKLKRKANEISEKKVEADRREVTAILLKVEARNRELKTLSDFYLRSMARSHDFIHQDDEHSKNGCRKRVIPSEIEEQIDSIVHYEDMLLDAKASLLSKLYEIDSTRYQGYIEPRRNCANQTAQFSSGNVSKPSVISVSNSLTGSFETIDVSNWNPTPGPSYREPPLVTSSLFSSNTNNSLCNESSKTVNVVHVSSVKWESGSKKDYISLPSSEGSTVSIEESDSEAITMDDEALAKSLQAAEQAEVVEYEETLASDEALAKHIQEELDRDAQRVRSDLLSAVSSQQPISAETKEKLLKDLSLSNKSCMEQQLHLELLPFIPNLSEIECPICLSPIEAFEGIVLKECGHGFCKQCLANTILNSTEAHVECPFMDDDTREGCHMRIDQAIAKAVLTESQFETYLERGLRVVELQAGNEAFHCRTPNCTGWCLFEDGVMVFFCNVCESENCIACRAIHEGRNCKEYQDHLQTSARLTEEEKKTKEHMEQLLARGEAMRCSQCQIAIIRPAGCDWIQCLMCKTELCWATKGPRWGPLGRGDTTGGCNCGGFSRKCHPSCQNCH